MIVSLGRLVAAKDTFNKLVNYTEFSAKKAYSMAKFAETFKNETELHERVRTDLIMRYGEEKDGLFAVKPDKFAIFQKEMESLNEQTIDLNFQLTIDELKGIGFSPLDFANIDFIMQNLDAVPEAVATELPLPAEKQ
jgi:hypothetical protein